MHAQADEEQAAAHWLTRAARHCRSQDISATCVEAGITSAGLATGKVDVAEVAQRLYLTENEANALIQECKRGSQPPAAPGAGAALCHAHSIERRQPAR